MQLNFCRNNVNRRVAILGLIPLLLGVLMFGGGYLARSRTSRTAQWPSVTGRITRSEVVTHIGGKSLRWVAEVEYAYTVGGRKYQCDQRRVIPMLHWSAPDPHDTVAKYRLGRSVEVYYDPEDPQDALLLPKPKDDAKVFMGILFFAGPCLGLIGLGVIVLTWPTPKSDLADSHAGHDPTSEVCFAEGGNFTGSM